MSTNRWLRGDCEPYTLYPYPKATCNGQASARTRGPQRQRRSAGKAACEYASDILRVPLNSL
eukprot:366021-Chlamydomonas_euryale.AAC.3